MKKLFALVMVLMASTLFADGTINITASDAGSGVLSVYYTVDNASTSDPVGIALNFSCSEGATVTSASAANVDPCFPVYLDQAHDTGSGYNFSPVQGTPIAKSDSAGVPSGSVSDFAVCMGRLGQAAPSKGVAHKLCDIQLTQGTANSTCVTIAADTLRGGVVGSTFTVNVPSAPVCVNFIQNYTLTTVVNGSGTLVPASGTQYAPGTEVTLTATPTANYYVTGWTNATAVAGTDNLQAKVTMNSDVTVTVTIAQECMKTTNAAYNDWKTLGRPDCWCYKRQCRGDSDNLYQGTAPNYRWVYSNDYTAFKNAYGKLPAQLAAVANGICSDYDHAGQGTAPNIRRVYSNDYTIFKSYYGKIGDVNVPVCDMTNYNFWK